MKREFRRRLGEAASLLSCALNVAIGTGDREITLSAGAWELRCRGAARARLLVPLIDAINRPVDGPDHCYRAWGDHAEMLNKINRERGRND